MWLFLKKMRTVQERVVTMPPTAEAQIDKIERGIEEVFESAGVDGNPNLRLAILARLSQKLMEQLEDSEST